MAKEHATEREWLLWFYNRADFGPAHDDVMSTLQAQFEEQTGKLVAKGYEYDQ